VSRLLTARGIDHAVIGAAALAAHGVARATADLDLLACDVRCVDEGLWEELRASGVVVQVRVGDEMDPLAGVVRITAADEAPVDLVVGKPAWQRTLLSRATAARFGEASIPLVTAVDLVLLKLYAGGPQGASDIDQLLDLDPSLAWNAGRHRDRDLAAGLDALVFQDDARALGRACVAMGDLYAQTGLVGWNASALHAALLASSMLLAMGTPDARVAAAIAESIEGLEQDVGRARPRCADGEIVVRELAQALRLARIGAWRLARRAGARAPDDVALRAELAAATLEQRACWLARARPGGLDDSVSRLEKTLAGDPR
jgi:hypothetical protein